MYSCARMCRSINWRYRVVTKKTQISRCNNLWQGIGMEIPFMENTVCIPLTNRYFGYRTKFYQFFFLLSLLLPCQVSAAFYCDVIPVNCENNAYGWQDTCGDSCGLCGDANCPATPEISTLAMLSESSCRPKIRESKRVRQCNSSLIEDASDRAFAGIFAAACEEHSICYHNQGYAKYRCDNHFEENIRQICQRLYALQPRQRWWLNEMNKPNFEGCMKAADIWVSTVKESGIGRFNNDKNWGLRNCPIE